MNRFRSARESTNLTSARTRVRARGRSWLALPAEPEAAAATTASERSPEPASPGRPPRPAVPAQRTARAQTRDATSSCDLARLRPTSPNVAQGGEWSGDPLYSASGRPGSPNHLRTPRGRYKSLDALGAPRTTREAPYQVDKPPNTTWLEKPVNTQSLTRRGCQSTTGILPFS